MEVESEVDSLALNECFESCNITYANRKSSGVGLVSDCKIMGATDPVVAFSYISDDPVGRLQTWYTSDKITEADLENALERVFEAQPELAE